jgi:hypothetical protein
MNRVFEEFGRLLDERFSRDVVTTEDSVRYTFFAALLNAEVTPDQVVLEYPHPAIDRAKIDTWLPAFNNESIAVEFKYDRDPPGGKNQPKTQKAGYVFKDFRRQELVAKKVGTRAFFVYVTSEEMAVYFRNSNNGHSNLWNLENGQHIVVDEQYLSDKPKTFLNVLGGMFKAQIEGVYHRDLSGGNYIRAYEVIPA